MAQLIDDKLTAQELEAVAWAMRRASFWVPLPSVTKDDMRQEAQVKVWQLRGQVPEFNHPDKTTRYLAKCATNAILDLRHRAFRQDHPTGQLLDRVEDTSIINTTLCLDDPEALLRVKRAVAAIGALPSPLPQAAALFMSGHSAVHIADRLGLSEARISQLRATIVNTLRKHMEIPR